MYNSTRDLLDALRVTPDTLTGLLVGVTQTQAQEARGGDEGWSVNGRHYHLLSRAAHGFPRCHPLRADRTANQG